MNKNPFTRIFFTFIFYLTKKNKKLKEKYHGVYTTKISNINMLKFRL